MTRPMQLLEDAWDHRAKIAAIAAVFFFVAWLRRGEQIAFLEGRPAVTDDVKTKVVTRLVEGPVRVVVKTVVAPDGTRTTEKTLERASREKDTGRESESHHVEVPPALPRSSRTRYVGLGIDPLNYARLPRLRAGVTVWNAVDVGVAYDSRFAPTSGAFGIEAAYRF